MVKGFIVRPVSAMMSEVPLPYQVERGWEENCHEDSQPIIDGAIRVQHSMFGFMNDRIDRIPKDCKGDKKKPDLPPLGCQGCRNHDRKETNDLAAKDQQIQRGRDRVYFSVRHSRHDNTYAIPTRYVSEGPATIRYVGEGPATISLAYASGWDTTICRSP